MVIELAVRYPQLTGPLIAVAPTGLPENPSLPKQVWRLMRDIPRERLAFWPLCLSAYVRTGICRFYQLARLIEHQGALPDLALVPRPVLLLGGARDPVVPVSALRRVSCHWPHVQVVEFAAAPHGMTDADAEGVTVQVRRWVGCLNWTGEAE
ncbi:hypothetical protein [Deinococcus saxicola]|uniref:hypothetical protein n=1 Tax=Deinococcus saxicola TaxID=249406 RepID=UPI0039F0E3DA